MNFEEWTRRKSWHYCWEKWWRACVMEVALFCRLGILWQRRMQLLYCELLLDVSPLCYLSPSLNS